MAQKRIRFKIGDIIEIPLADRKKTFAQYLGVEFWGDLIQVYDYQVDINKKIDVESLKEKKYMFSPISTRIRQGMKLSELASQLDDFKARKIVLHSKLVKLLQDTSMDPNWRIIGNIPVEDFKFPNFIWKDGGPEKKNIVTKWYLYDGKRNIEIGKRLPNQYKNLEYHTSYSPGGVIERILTGKNPDEEIIKKG